MAEKSNSVKRSDVDESNTEGNSFSIMDVVMHPTPGYVTPASFNFSPDDSIISYLYSPEGTLNRKLFYFDPSSGKHGLLLSPPGGGVEEGNISNAERLRRERLRERGLGVTRYEWSRSAKDPKILVPLPDGIYVQDGHPESELRLLVSTAASSTIQDPQISPDGSAVAYVMENELWVVATAAGTPYQMTYGAQRSGKTHGLAEYIAQEEMERRYGFWWSSDSQYIAFTEVDNSAIPLFRIMHQGKSVVGSESEEDHAYPFAGKSNAKVKLGVVCVKGKRSKTVTWMDIDCGANDEFHYLARVHWLPDSSLMVEVENRAQTKLSLLKFDSKSGKRSLILEESCNTDTWINLNSCFIGLRSTGGFIWASERTGYQHLYLYSAEGECIRSLTQGDWLVDHVVGVDELKERVYFLGSFDSPLELHLYCVDLSLSFSSPAPRRLTEGKGRHQVLVEHRLHRFVDIFDSVEGPPVVCLRDIETGGFIASIFEQEIPNPRAVKLKIQAPEIVSLPGANGTQLFGAIYRPDPSLFGPPPYKTVVSVYGGPHVQLVKNSWQSVVDMRAQFLRSRGFLVWKLDNRGSWGRGQTFESAIRKRMGTVDVEDQETGVQWLINEGLADAERVGIFGWSYGGYMSAMCLAKCPEIFKCAVAGAPVTSWDGYDTHYTERYMGHPEEDPGSYEESSVMAHVGGIQGKLLLVHGMIDENVHFRHTARLINALIAARKEYELLLFPDERHMPRGLPDRMYLEERIFAFLERNLC